MIIKNVLVDWLFIWEKGNKGKYGVCVIFPKGSDQEKQVKAAIDKATAAGVSTGKFTAANTKSASFKKCLRDGDYEIETEDRPEHYKGMSFFNANNYDQPGIVGTNAEPLMDQKRLYSGCTCHVDVGFFAFNNESKGVGAGFNNIMLVEEGERLDGRQNAEEAFAGLATDDDLQ